MKGTEKWPLHGVLTTTAVGSRDWTDMYFAGPGWRNLVALENDLAYNHSKLEGLPGLRTSVIMNVTVPRPQVT